MIKQAFYKSIPVMAGYIVLGTGFGILMHNAGYGVLWTAAMSLFIYAGSMQYVGVNLLTGGASVITTALTTKDHIPALTGLLSTLVCLVIFGRDRFLIPAMLLITLVLTLLRGKEEAQDREEAKQ